MGGVAFGVVETLLRHYLAIVGFMWPTFEKDPRWYDKHHSYFVRGQGEPKCRGTPKGDGYMFAGVALGVCEPVALDVLNMVANGWGTMAVFGVYHWLLGVWLGGVWEGVSHHEPFV